MPRFFNKKGWLGLKSKPVQPREESEADPVTPAESVLTDAVFIDGFGNPAPCGDPLSKANESTKIGGSKVENKKLNSKKVAKKVSFESTVVEVESTVDEADSLAGSLASNIDPNIDEKGAGTYLVSFSDSVPNDVAHVRNDVAAENAEITGYDTNIHNLNLPSSYLYLSNITIDNTGINHINKSDINYIKIAQMASSSSRSNVRRLGQINMDVAHTSEWTDLEHNLILGMRARGQSWEEIHELCPRLRLKDVKRLFHLLYNDLPVGPAGNKGPRVEVKKDDKIIEEEPIGKDEDLLTAPKKKHKKKSKKSKKGRKHGKTWLQCMSGIPISIYPIDKEKYKPRLQGGHEAIRRELVKAGWARPKKVKKTVTVDQAEKVTEESKADKGTQTDDEESPEPRHHADKGKAKASAGEGTSGGKVENGGWEEDEEDTKAGNAVDKGKAKAVDIQEDETVILTFEGQRILAKMNDDEEFIEVNGHPIMRFKEDGGLTHDELQKLYFMVGRWQGRRWLEVASRFYDKTGKRVNHEELAGIFGDIADLT